MGAISRPGVGDATNRGTIFRGRAMWFFPSCGSVFVAPEIEHADVGPLANVRVHGHGSCQSGVGAAPPEGGLVRWAKVSDPAEESGLTPSVGPPISSMPHSCRPPKKRDDSVMTVLSPVVPRRVAAPGCPCQKRTGTGIAIDQCGGSGGTEPQRKDNAMSAETE